MPLRTEIAVFKILHYCLDVFLIDVAKTIFYKVIVTVSLEEGVVSKKLLQRAKSRGSLQPGNRKIKCIDYD